MTLHDKATNITTQNWTEYWKSTIWSKNLRLGRLKNLKSFRLMTKRETNIKTVKILSMIFMCRGWSKLLGSCWKISVVLSILGSFMYFATNEYFFVDAQWHKRLMLPCFLLALRVCIAGWSGPCKILFFENIFIFVYLQQIYFINCHIASNMYLPLKWYIKSSYLKFVANS